jgi:hypothetical protein
LMADGTGTHFTIAGFCNGVQAVVVTNHTVLGSMSTLAPNCQPHAVVTLAEGSGFAHLYACEAQTVLQLSSGPPVSVKRVSDWIAGDGKLFISPTGAAQIGLNFLDGQQTAITVDGTLRGRGDIVSLGEDHFVVLPLIEGDGSRVLVIGPIRDPDDTMAWGASIAITGPNPLLDAAPLDDRHFVVAGREADNSVLVAIASNSFSPEYRIPAPFSAQMRDLSIAVARDGMRASIFVAAATSTELYSTRVSVCGVP